MVTDDKLCSWPSSVRPLSGSCYIGYGGPSVLAYLHPRSDPPYRMPPTRDLFYVGHGQLTNLPASSTGVVRFDSSLTMHPWPLRRLRC
jgi:hypothetical protein